jgi:hypothetical protein
MFSCLQACLMYKSDHLEKIIKEIIFNNILAFFLNQE